jgi:NAD(P)H dehydrogenase (quinone)
MRAHIVLAHPEPRSFNGHLAEEARAALAALGWEVTATDLYGCGFDPREGPAHYVERADAARFDAQREQRHAGDVGALPAFVAEELQRLDAADLLILQYPMWWHMPPAILKGWFDRVFAYGPAYTARRRFETGRFQSKRALLSVTVGTSRPTYEHDGRSGDISLMLWPVEFTLAYVGYDILAPFVAYGVEGGLRYSDAGEIEARLQGIVAELRGDLTRLDARPRVQFNRMAEWGADGRIRPEAPVYSPYIRHRRDLDLG